MADICECGEKALSKRLDYIGAIRFLSKYVKRHKSNFIKFYFGWLFDTILAIIMPVLFGIMIDEVVYKQNVPLFLKLSGIYVILAVFSCVLYFFIYAQHHYLMSMYTLDIKLDLFKHMLQCDAEYLSDMSTGDIATLLQRDSDECMHFIIRNVIHLINNGLSIVIILIYLCKIDFGIGLFAMITAPFSVYINTKFGKKIREYGEEERKVYGKYISWIYEILSALKDIRLLGAQRYVGTKFDDFHKDIYDVEQNLGMISYLSQKFIDFVVLAVRLSIFVFAGWLATKGQITIGILTVILSFYSDLTFYIGAVGNSYLDAQHRISLIQKIYDFLQAPTEEDFSESKELVVTEGTINIENLSFSYKNGTQILSNVNLMIHAGEKIAITGESGSGKTTLAYLLVSFYKPQKGEIYIDEQRLSECSLRSIRNQIGLVAQDVLMFPGTIRENIKLGNPKATDEQIETACKQAEIWEVIKNLPDGLDTIIGIQGNDLSGGQKQRIAIARIYLKNPQIIIFDEATSALDSETEKEIHNAWNKVLTGRTAIIITHRESTLMYCDRVISLEGGKVC